MMVNYNFCNSLHYKNPFPNIDGQLSYICQDGSAARGARQAPTSDEDGASQNVGRLGDPTNCVTPRIFIPEIIEIAPSALQ